MKSGDEASVRMGVEVEEAGGLVMWREQWDESVSEIYEKILGKFCLDLYFSRDREKKSN